MVTVCGMTSFFYDNINVLDGVMGRENPQTKRFLVQFKNAYTVVN